jgi:hypothetical protein
MRDIYNQIKFVLKIRYDIQQRYREKQISNKCMNNKIQSFGKQINKNYQ